MSKKDSLQSFMFEQGNVRGKIVHLHSTYQTILRQRPYPPMVKKLLGEALLACLLLSDDLKCAGVVSVQFQGDKRLPLLLVQCDHLLRLRAYAQYQVDLESKAYEEAFLQGQMVLTMNLEHQTQAYQSVIPLQFISMSENLMHYLTQSEQIPSRIWLAVTEEYAAGMILQKMPGNTNVEEALWEYATHMGETIRQEELLTLDDQTLLYRLYHETELRLFPSRPICFHCSCNKEKMRQVLTILSQEEITQLLTEKELIEISCDFCNSYYHFDAQDL